MTDIRIVKVRAKEIYRFEAEQRGFDIYKVPARGHAAKILKGQLSRKPKVRPTL